MQYTEVIGLLIVYLGASVVAAPYQLLEQREGYVPVYIRVGDTPLIEINHKLAEAFNEIEGNDKQLSDAGSVVTEQPDVSVGSTDGAETPHVDDVSSGSESSQLIGNISESPAADDDSKSEEDNSTEVLQEVKEVADKLMDVVEVEALEKLNTAINGENTGDQGKKDESSSQSEEESKETTGGIGAQERGTSAPTAGNHAINKTNRESLNTSENSSSESEDTRVE